MPFATLRKAQNVALVGAALSTLALMAGCAGDPSASFEAAAPVAPLQPPGDRSSGAAQPAVAPNAPADLMQLGEAAPAPLGYLRFCGRRPDQCGLQAAADPDALTKALIAKYYWAVAFASAKPDLSLSPASGATDGYRAPTQAGDQPFDWSTVFGPAVRRAPPPGQSAPAAAPNADPTSARGADVAATEPSARGLAFADGSDVAIRALIGVDAATLWRAGWTQARLSPWTLTFRTPLSARAATLAPPQADAAPVQMGAALMAVLRRVDDRVNNAIRYVSDIRQYGAEDYWTLPLEPGGSAAGDCKDYVLEKRRALVDEGVPADDLSIAIVRTRWGEDHAVLLVSTDQGELVLDSLSPAIVQWRKAPYSWLERQAPGQPLVWVKIGAERRKADRPAQRITSASTPAFRI